MEWDPLARQTKEERTEEERCEITRINYSLFVYYCYHITVRVVKEIRDVLRKEGRKGRTMPRRDGGGE